MVVDTSALVAIIRGEPEGPSFEALMLDDELPSVSAPTMLELSLVVGPDAWQQAMVILTSLGCQTQPFDAAQFEIARVAHARFGRGSGSPARLNFGDCFSYALAITRDEPLLFKGDDFAHTDVRPAL